MTIGQWIIAIWMAVSMASVAMVAWDQTDPWNVGRMFGMVLAFWLSAALIARELRGKS